MKILITGASSGIGFLTGCVLADRGHDVYMTTKTCKEELVLKNKIKMLELDVSVFKLDVTNKEDRGKIELLDLDVLFLHAGIGYVGLLKDMDINLVRDNFEVNVFSNLEIIQLFLKDNSKPKKIVITSSLFANHACPYFGSYILSKSCIDLMTKILRNESILSKNKFMLIKPGAYHTGFNQYLLLSGEKSGVSSNILSVFGKVFLCFEERKLNSIVEKLVYAIEKGNDFKYSAPFIQRLILDNWIDNPPLFIVL